MDSLFDLSPTSPLDEYNATLILTRTIHHTTTSTVSEVVTVTATTTVTKIVASATTPKLTSIEIPYFPKVDTAFTAIFATCCLLLLVGVILRNKKRKRKGFNIPLFLGSLCIP
jgi:carbohydrate-binding DOMON domain-containing protein